MVLKYFQHSICHLGLRLGRSKSYPELYSGFDEGLLCLVLQPEKDRFPDRLEKFDRIILFELLLVVYSFTRARRAEAVVEVRINKLNFDWCTMYNCNVKLLISLYLFLYHYVHISHAPSV